MSNSQTFTEYCEVKKMLTQLISMLNMLIPNKVSVSYIAETTGESRQNINQYLYRNFETEKEFWNEGGKTFMNREVAVTLLTRYNNKKLAYAA